MEKLETIKEPKTITSMMAENRVFASLQMLPKSTTAYYISQGT